MSNILWQQFNGISDSLFSGIKNSFYKMVGLDIHSNPGSISVNQKLTKHSGSTITELCRVSLAVSDGSKIWFSYTSGKIWRESGGTYTLMYTTSPTAGNAGCLGAGEYNSYIYWATQSRLHRIAVADIATASWTGAVPNWQTFTKTDSEFHPMVVQNASLFIGDGNLVSSVNSSATFTASALDILNPLRIKTMEPYDIDLILGTIIHTSVNRCEVIRWDTVQTTWQYSRPVRENGINAFLWAGDVLLAQCGTYGKFYWYDGLTLKPYKRLPGTWTPSKYGEVFPNAVGVLRGVPIFGFSNGAGNPCDNAIYSIGSYSQDYKPVITEDYIISQNVVASLSIGSIIVDGQDLYVAWQEGSNFGVDKLDYSNKYASGYLETIRLTPDIENITASYRFLANYQSLPTDTSLTFKYKKNNDISWTPLTNVDDTSLAQIYAEETIEARAFQWRVEFTTSGNNTPVVELLGILFAN